MSDNYSKPKKKKPITNTLKLGQVRSWNESSIVRESTDLRPKKVQFDKTISFLDACINFYEEEIDDLLKSGVDINCCDKDNLTALHQACINDNLDMVKYLLNRNANINVCDKEGWTPLHVAADIGSFELTKLLIDRGAKLDLPNFDGELPIHFVKDDKDDLKRYMEKVMEKQSINIDECVNVERKVMLEDVRKWKKSGEYDPPLDKFNRSTPLHVAASKNYLEVLVELIPLLKETDLNVQDIDGWCALHAAAHWGHLEACIMLVKSGADPDMKTFANESILDLADKNILDQLRENLNQARLERERLKLEDVAVNDIAIRSDNANRRRSSIIRQSVESKKIAQMKETVAERRVLSRVGLSNNEVRSSPIEENSVNIKRISEEEESSPLVQETKLKKVFELKPSTVDGDQRTNSLKIDNSTANIITSTNSENDSDITDTSPNSNDASNDEERPVVKLRPKSQRDTITEHRETAGTSRLSLVMAPAKSNESEVTRREISRRVRSVRRSTQGIDLTGVKEIEKKRELSMISDECDHGLTITVNQDQEQTPPTVIEPLCHETALPKNYSNTSVHKAAELAEQKDMDMVNFCKDDPKSKVKLQMSASFSYSPPKINPNIQRSTARLNVTNVIGNLMRNQQSFPRPSSGRPASIISFNPPNEKYDTQNKSETRDVNSLRPIKFSDKIGDLSSDSIDSGSFVAKPVSASSLKIDSINETDKTQVNNEVQSYAKDDAPNLTYTKEEICIPKSIANRLVHEEAAKIEMQTEIEALKEEIKKLNREKVMAESISNKPLASNNDLVIKLEGDLMKSKEEIKKLKSQNEALLRVISRIQQELEAVRKISSTE